MKVLVINAGSSSLKYQLIDMEDESVKAKGLCERIGIDGSKLTHKVPGKEDFVVDKDMPTHQTAIELVLEALIDPEKDISLVLFPKWYPSIILITPILSSKPLDIHLPPSPCIYTLFNVSSS